MFHFRWFRGRVAAYTPKGVCMPRHGQTWQYRGKVPRPEKAFYRCFHAFVERCHGRATPFATEGATARCHALFGRWDNA